MFTLIYVFRVEMEGVKELWIIWVDNWAGMQSVSSSFMIFLFQSIRILKVIRYDRKSTFSGFVFAPVTIK